MPAGGEEGIDLDEKLRQLLRDLSRALHSAMEDSEEVGATIRRFREEGYTLQLMVDCKREPGAENVPVGLPAGTPTPSFRINGQDLAFLRSIGIDPTRRRRRASSRRTPTS